METQIIDFLKQEGFQESGKYTLGQIYYEMIIGASFIRYYLPSTEETAWLFIEGEREGEIDLVLSQPSLEEVKIVFYMFKARFTKDSL